MFSFFKQPRTLTANNEITVNIWEPRIDDEVVTTSEFLQRSRKNTLGNDYFIGHVSLATGNDYMSWWPAPGVEENPFLVIRAVENTYEGDVQAEGIDPHHVVKLYSLDVAKLLKAIDDIRIQEVGYVLAGDKTLTRGINNWFSRGKGHNCSGLIYDLLIKAGLWDLMSYTQDLTAQYLISTPENLKNLLQGAKERELKRYPETKAFNNAQAAQQSAAILAPR